MNVRRSLAERRIARELVSHYQAHTHAFQSVLNSLGNQITSSPRLKPYIHSLRSRTKSIDSLEGKIFRKMDEAKEANRQFRINTENLFVKINDLAGLRILHLNTDQLPDLAAGLNELLEEEMYTLVEKPTARAWDDESRELLGQMGFKIVNRRTKPSFYTSIHYVIYANRKTKITCEIQVRTLTEELWGEIDHLINYPHKVQRF